MHNFYSDPTASAAIGAVEKELRWMRKKAKQLRIRYQAGKLSEQEEAAIRKEFIGIYRPLLKDIFRK